ncbi:MAG: TRAM domain-containing protein [Candidatus Parvarchaeota archaeon]|nr:TRAM domain-containing protein [Candidatus Jingweiarchaeum tengchongense]MCW1298631.1 TRAM domain-containing protein [Candidatus Jingweiarchaeum tengchongense]MCW1300473.1 TRAM domain-containing protein [Candidatus Jingweiarchaeum tengchongense]MCW1304712.1 TRAM domain-containing protein [Candidatus Jingweiarchaeum tengchongense]MCW1306217.1 TRAM domain-containing protein [Candidatus Jingweiarchaeum tengchongense]
MNGFGQRRFMRKEFEKPVKEGEIYDVTISEIGEKGDGVTRIKGFVIFVPNTKEGEKLKIKIKQVARRFAIGERLEG